MATDKELLEKAKRIDAAARRKRAAPKKAAAKRRAAPAKKRSAPRPAPTKRLAKRAAKRAAKKRGVKACSTDALTVMLPKGSHLSVVGHTFEVVGKGGTPRKVGAAPSKPTTRKRARKARKS